MHHQHILLQLRFITEDIYNRRREHMVVGIGILIPLERHQVIQVHLAVYISSSRLHTAEAILEPKAENSTNFDGFFPGHARELLNSFGFEQMGFVNTFV